RFLCFPDISDHGPTAPYSGKHGTGQFDRILKQLAAAGIPGLLIDCRRSIVTLRKRENIRKSLKLLF
ncbi:MAG: hypothetical protein MUP93_04425, partial [Pirellulales bacterium]|nr:hypothetical protein [Pirellulales bacterium]